MASGLTTNIPASNRFNPELPDQNPEDFTGASHGAKSQEYAPTEYAQHENTVFAGNLRTKADAPTNWGTYVRPVITDRSAGILYEGLGQVAGEGITVADKLYKGYVQGQVQQQVDQVQDQFGVGAADAVYGTSQGTPPKELEKQASYLDDLTQAYQNGTIKQSHYWAKMDVVARDMRQRFPLYSDYVDKVIENYTGNRPANALQRALEQEANDGRENTPEVRRQKLEDWMVKNIQMPPDYFARRDQGRPYTETEMQQYIATEKAQDFATERDTKRIQTAKDQDQLDHQDAKNVAQRGLWDTFHKTMLGMNSAWATSYESMRKLAQSAETDGNVTPEEQQSILQAWRPLRAMILDGANNYFNSEVTPGGGTTWAGTLAPADLKELRGGVDDFLSTTEDSLTHKQFGVIASNQAMFDAMQTSGAITAVDLAPRMRSIVALNKAVGPELTNSILQADETGMKALSKVISDKIVLDGFTNESKGKSVQGDFNDLADKDPKLIVGTLSRFHDNILNEETSPELRGTAAVKLFKDDFTQSTKYQFTNEQQQAYYSNFTTEKFANHMAALGASQPDAYKAYVEWVTNKSINLNSTAINDAKDIRTSRPNMKLNWDPKTHSLQIEEGTGSTATYGSSPSAIVEKILEPSARNSVARINTSLQGLVNVFRTEKGMTDEKIDDNIMRLLHAKTGIDFGSPDTGDHKNVVMNMYDYIGDAFRRAYETEKANVH